MRQPYPPKGYGGTQRSMAQMTVFQAAMCAHDITLYGPADSTIIEFAAGIAAKLGLDAQKSETSISILNADGRTGHIRLRTSGRAAIGYRDPNERSYNRELIRLILEDEGLQPFDIVHSHDKALTALLLNSEIEHHKILTHSHETRIKYSTHKYPVICLSRSHAEGSKQRGIFVYDTLHHGLDPFTHHYVEEHAGYLVWVGRMIAYKGPLTAIDIARKAGKPIILAGTTHGRNDRSKKYFAKSIQPHLDITDEGLLDRLYGKPNDEIMAEIATICTHTRTPAIFVGGADERQKQTLYGHAEATLFPIKWREPFGRVMIESMACGTPVVGNVRIGSVHCGAVEEVIEDGVTGFHIAAGNDQEAIDKAVLAVNRLGEIDRKQVRSVFDRDWTSERLAKQLDDTYRRRLAEPAVPLDSYDSSSIGKLKRLLRISRE